MIKITSTLLLSICCFFTSHAQNSMSGKNYKALLRSSCIKMVNGGCMQYDYNLLKFEKDSVIVSSKMEVRCVPKEREKGYQSIRKPISKKYHWSIKNNMISIEGFDEYGKLSMVGEELIGYTKGLDHIGLGGPKKVVYIEERLKK